MFPRFCIDTQQPNLGLGTYSILWPIAEAKRRKLPHVYLGYWEPQDELQGELTTD
jgi:arginyl-tRNA--protein-N-Asp/Glu arginylyltransferase